jgi:hypothetical protein
MGTPCFPPGHKCDCVQKGIMGTVTESTEVNGPRKYRRKHLAKAVRNTART